MQRTLINEALVLKRNYIWVIYYYDNDGNVKDTFTSGSTIKFALEVAARFLRRKDIPIKNIKEVRQFKQVGTYKYGLEDNHGKS